MSEKPESASNVAEYTVSEISGALKRTVEDTFGHVRVRGEISGYRGPHSSGHAYFSMKDDKARIEAVIWRSAMSRLRFQPEEGMEVIATGKLTTIPRLVEIPDRHRADGTGRCRRADGAAGRAQAQARRRRSVRPGNETAAALHATRHRRCHITNRGGHPRHHPSHHRSISAARSGLAGTGSG